MSTCCQLLQIVSICFTYIYTCRMKILICEDETEIAHLHQANLRRIIETSKIDIAYTGGVAAKLLEHNAYDLILCDQNLGDDLSGLDLLVSVRKSSVMTPFILCTSMEPPLLQNDRNYFFLRKPYRLSELQDAVNSLIISDLNE